MLLFAPLHVAPHLAGTGHRLGNRAYAARCQDRCRPPFASASLRRYVQMAAVYRVLGVSDLQV